MEIFRKKNPIADTSEVKNKIESNYRIFDVNYYLFKNDRNTVYLLENDSFRFIFKIYEYNAHHIEEIKAETELLDLLHQYGVHVSYPISDQNGNFIQDFLTDEDSLYGVLYSYAEGCVSELMNDEQLASAARELAKIHRITKDINLNYAAKKYTLNSIIIEALQIIKPAFTDLDNEYNYLFKISHEIIKKFELFDLTGLPSGYCHFDYSPTNFHFQDDYSITIFDFESMRKGFLAIDIACFYGYYFFMNRSNKVSNEEANHAFSIFIENYSAIKSLSDLEIRVIPYFFFARVMVGMQFKVEYQIDLKYLKIYVESLKLFIEREILPPEA